MHKLITLISVAIIVFGLFHIFCAYPFPLQANTLWFAGAGLAIIFSGFINILAIERGGTSFARLIALVANGFNCMILCLSLLIKTEPQVYVGILIFLTAIIACRHWSLILFFFATGYQE